MNDTIQIRKINKNDLERAFELLNELNEGDLDRETFLRNFDQKVQDENSYCICAANGDEIIGILFSEFRSKFYDSKKRLYVEDLIVDEKYRGRGVGEKILLELVEYAKNNNCGSIELTSVLENEAAHRFYEKNNFKKHSYKFKQSI